MVLKDNKKKYEKKTGNSKSKKFTLHIEDDNPKTSGYYAIIIFLSFIIIDRITKVWALTLADNKFLDFGIVEFVYTTNTGAGFSILQNQNTLLSWIAVIALGIIIYYYSYFPKLGFLMIISGIIGNLIDRLIYGYVIDFINFKIWPVFNIADSFVFLGVAYTVIIWLRKDREKNIQNDKKIDKKNSKKIIRKKITHKK
ncbi:TPA: signal peptidase II [bacterium]|nr:signal peptidase II [bacterium]